jgi:hypothetical protein
MLTQLGLLSIQNDGTQQTCECYIEGRVHVCVSEHLCCQRYARVLCPLCNFKYILPLTSISYTYTMCSCDVL